jgi:hypothetical protein
LGKAIWNCQTWAVPEEIVCGPMELKTMFRFPVA